MPLLSSTTIITSVSVFHLTLAWLFLTSPNTLADQTIVFILGEAMGMPEARGFQSPSASLSLVSLLLTVISLSDLASLSLPHPAQHLHWSSQAPLRFAVTFGIAMYSFLFGHSSPLFNKNPRGHFAHPVAANKFDVAGASLGFGDGLKNRVVFTFVFLEALAWFWVFTSLREERVVIMVEKRREV